MRWLRRASPLEDARWVVIDCETSGLDMERDRLLSVGAVAVHGRRIALAEAYQALVRQATPSEPANILVHGIHGDAQLAGRPLEQVVDELGRFVAGGIPVAFHAAFDAAVLRRHGLRPAQDWLDLAALLPALFAQRKPRQGSLDHWLREFAIAPQARHEALGDAFAAAQLLLAALAEASRQRLRTVEALRRLQRDARWAG